METLGKNILEELSVLVNNYNSLERRCKELEATQYDANKFYAVPLGVDIVAKLHNVSPYLVRQYIKLGLIPMHPSSTDSKFLVRGSDALLLDFNKMREQSKAKRYVQD